MKDSDWPDGSWAWPNGKAMAATDEHVERQAAEGSEGVFPIIIKALTFSF